MRCEQARPLLQAFGDGEVEEGVRRQVWEHVQHCPQCRREFESRRELVGQLQVALRSQDRAPARVAAAISQRLASQASPPRGFLSEARRIGRMRVTRIAFSAAGVVAALLVGVWFFAGQDLAFARAIDKALRGIRSAHFTAVEGDRTVEVWATPTEERVSTKEGWLVAKDGRAYLFNPHRKQVAVSKGAAAHLRLLRSMNVLLLSERLRGRALGHPKVTKETVTLPNGSKAIRIAGAAQAKRHGVVLNYEGSMLVDPGTNLILRGEARQLIPNTPEAKQLEKKGLLRPMQVKVEKVEYNQPVPAGTFDTAVPPGWRRVGR